MLSMGTASFAAESIEAQIISPSDGEWVDPYKAITVRWSTPSGGKSYQITIKNERTGSFVVRNKTVSGNSYTIASNTLDYEEKYKIWVGTFEGNTAIGAGDVVYVSVNDRLNSQKIYREADFVYPTNREEVPTNTNLRISLSGDRDLAYNLSVKDLTNGKTIVSEKGLTSTTYTVSSNLLVAGHSYKAWVGTYKKASAEKKEFGPGKSVEFTVAKDAENTQVSKPPAYTPTKPSTSTTPSIPVDTPESKKDYEAAEISFPTDGSWLDPTQKIVIKLDNTDWDLDYGITIKDDVTGEYIVKDDEVNSSSYAVSANTFMSEHRYKVILTTYENGKVIGDDRLTINMNEVDYIEAKFEYPENDDVVDPSKKITIKLSDTDSDLCYRISMVETDSNKTVYRNKKVSGNSFSVSAGTLQYDKEYKLWVGTYLNEASTEAVGAGDIIYIRTAEEEFEDAEKEAYFTYPQNDDVVNNKKDLTVKWKKADIDTYYSITIKNETDDTYIAQNELVTGTSYKVKASKLKAKSQYKMWLGTYSNKSDKKEIIGKGDIVYFNTDGVIPVLVLSLTHRFDCEGMRFEYELTGENFGYATIKVTDSKDEELYYNAKETNLNGSVVIGEGLKENETYTCEIQTYTNNGEKAAFKSDKYKLPKSGFSVSGVKKPTGQIKYGKDFDEKGVVGSSYPIREVSVSVFADGDESNVLAGYINKNYHKKADNANEFDISGNVGFEYLSPGKYTYRVSVTDFIGNSYIAAESDFSVVREPGVYDDVPSNHKNYKAIKQLSVDGILAGDGSGKFRPDDPITRAEFVKMLYFAFKLSPVSSRDSRRSFSDVDTKHWAYTYIVSAFNNGIINGKGNGKFAPGDYVTFAEASKMLVCIKGWGDTAEQNGGWSEGYTMVAKENGFLGNTSLTNDNYLRNASRADVAQMFYNALNQEKNVVGKADKTYTVNGVKLYAYKFASGYYVDTAKAFPAFGGYDNKSSSTNLKGNLQIWDKNITEGGKSLKIDYNFEGKSDGYYQELPIKLTQNGYWLSNSEYKKYFKKNKVRLTCRDGAVLINVDDLAMLTNHMIENGSFNPDPNRDVTIIAGILYSNDEVIKNAQIYYDGIEEQGGQRYLEESLSLFNKSYNGAIEAYSKSNDINAVYNTVGYLTSATISVGSLCVGDVVGFGSLVGNLSFKVSLDVASSKFKELLDSEDDFVCVMLSNADVNSYKEFADYHISLNRDTMTKKQAIEYLTKYYVAKINSQTILMAFNYFAIKCPENFSQALLKTIEAAIDPIVTAVVGDIWNIYEPSQLAFDVASFLCGNSLTLINNLEDCDNEIISNWAKNFNIMNKSLAQALNIEE